MARKKFPRFKALIPLLILLGLIYIAIGDRLLRDPYGRASTQTRNSILRFLNIGVADTLERLPQDGRGAAREQELQESGI